MKVQVTVDVSDSARLGISMAQEGDIKLASRQLCREWIIGTLEPKLALAESAVEDVKRIVLTRLELQGEASDE